MQAHVVSVSLPQSLTRGRSLYYKTPMVLHNTVLRALKTYVYCILGAQYVKLYMVPSNILQHIGDSITGYNNKVVVGE